MKYLHTHRRVSVGLPGNAAHLILEAGLGISITQCQFSIYLEHASEKYSPPMEPRIGGEKEFLPKNNRIHHHYCRVLWDQVYSVTMMDEVFTLVGVSAPVWV